MTKKQWLKRERLPHYSGINARQQLKTLIIPCEPWFNLAIDAKTPDIKRVLFKIARDIRSHDMKQGISKKQWQTLGGLRNSDLFTSTDRNGKTRYFRVLDNR